MGTHPIFESDFDCLTEMSARPFGCNLIRRPNAGGRTLLENWVEERATKQFDENADRQQIQRKGHSNIISGEPGDNLNLTTTAEYYQIPEKPLKESEPGSLAKLRHQRALQQVLEEERKSQLEDEPPRRENPHIPRPPEPAKCAPTWIQEKPLSVWSELQSKRRLVGGTAGPEFKRSATYSTPIVHQLDEQVDVPCQQRQRDCQ